MAVLVYGASIWEIRDIKCRRCGTTVRPSMSRDALMALGFHDAMFHEDEETR